ncbi:MAG: hypothetical protein IJ083_15730 [Clostridia bacterium]|nr:hypothetical protein [Clostridia bacterium]
MREDQGNISLHGTWNCTISRDGETQAWSVTLPGTLDQNQMGFPDHLDRPWHPDAAVNCQDTDVITSRLTRKHTFTGVAKFTRSFSFEKRADERVFLEVERARELTVILNGHTIPPFRPQTLATPHVFEVTDALLPENTLTILSDNSYPSWPKDDILDSSMATDETQTNWNGLLGYIRLRRERETFAESIRVLPGKDAFHAEVTLSSLQGWQGTLWLCTGHREVSLFVSMAPGRAEFRLPEIPWDGEDMWEIERDEENRLLEITLSGDGLEEKSVSFGRRVFGDAGDGRISLNGRGIFLRSEANCAVFPDTGYPPMDETAWEKIIRTYQAYGVNCLRFHSHVPPESAFSVADRLGMLMQPELDCWNPKNAFEGEVRQRYYMAELQETVRFLGNHPSFVMLTFGNELHAGEEGHAFMGRMLLSAREIDPTRLYANGSNPHYGALGCDADSDFYTSQSFGERAMRATSAGMQGYLNHEIPGTEHQYSDAMQALRKTYKKPVFTFEIGQYEVLPDFGELEQFAEDDGDSWTTCVTRPDNLAHVRSQVRDKGFQEIWPRQVRASGALAALCYREEVEAALRTPELSGISLLGLQDFPGQGTALVGLMNTHLEPKPFPEAQGSWFHQVYRSVVPLARFQRYTWYADEEVRVRLQLANYGKSDWQGTCVCTLRGGEREEKREIPGCIAPQGRLSDLGSVAFSLKGFPSPQKLTLAVRCGEHALTWPLWVYPRLQPACPASVYETEQLDARAIQVLRDGGKVYLTPMQSKESMPRSIQAQFSTDFWSVGTFPFQEGGMGQLIDEDHPLFRNFPTEEHTNWQWWRMANRRAMILPAHWRSIIGEMDSYLLLRPMAQLFEGRCLNGYLMVSSLSLGEMEAPECRCLQEAIYTYLASLQAQDIRGMQELPLEKVQGIFRNT